jgi:flavodoxin
MKFAVRYYSRAGSTRKAAEAIAQALNVKAETIEVPLHEPVDYLFLGNSVYAGKPDEKVTAFVKALDPAMVKKVVNFGTAASSKTTYKTIAALLHEKGIPLEDREFHCPGHFLFFHRGRPNEKDLKAAADFARSFIQ